MRVLSPILQSEWPFIIYTNRYQNPTFAFCLAFTDILSGLCLAFSLTFYWLMMGEIGGGGGGGKREWVVYIFIFLLPACTSAIKIIVICYYYWNINLVYMYIVGITPNDKISTQDHVFPIAPNCTPDCTHVKMNHRQLGINFKIQNSGVLCVYRVPQLRSR